MRFRRFITLLVVPALLTPVFAQNSDVRGTWTAELRAGKAFLQVRTTPPPDWRGDRWDRDWSMGQTVPLDEVSGIPATDEQFTVSAIRFELQREAGTLAFEGAFRDGRGAGLFSFAPRPDYAAEMKSLGYSDDLPTWRRFQLAVHDVGPKYIRALKSEGYDKLTLDAVQRAKSHGVSIDYVHDLKALGYKPAALDDLVRTRDHGVTADFIKAMRSEGVAATATLEELTRLRDHGVTQQYVQEMRKAGFTSAAIEDLVRARDHGVNPQYVQEIKGLGLGVSGLDQFVRMRDHGVTPAFVRELGAQGFKNVPVDDIVRVRDHGVTAEDIADMREIFKDVTLSELVRLRDHGITPGFVNHVRARGYKPADVEEIVRLKSSGLR